MKLISISILTLLVFSQATSAYELKNLSKQDLLVIGAAMGKQPFDDVAGLYSRIQSQIIDQDKQANVAAKAAADDAESQKRAKMKAEVRSELDAERSGAPNPAKPDGDSK